MEQYYFPAPTVRHVEVEGLRIILDIGTETYRILDDPGSALWPVLIGETDPSAAFASLARSYDLTEDCWTTELGAFANRCLAEGLLVDAPPRAVGAPGLPPLTPPRNSGAGTFRALICLRATQRSLARHGFRATYEQYAMLPGGRGSSILEAALRAFSRAENVFVARRAPGDCLVRSLSLYRFLRSADVSAVHVIGVRRFAFSAHAWVEYGGIPLLDERAREFTPIAHIGCTPAA